MKKTKDNFSEQAADYQKFRPHYPDALYEYLFAQLKHFDTAWDCGTGNGQVAVQLAKRFRQVYGSDISAQQLAQAKQQQNIHYLKTRAEQSTLAPTSIDLITVAQAFHWFDFDAFYQEARRVAKEGALLAIWGYGLIRISPALDPLLRELYSHTLGPYWDAERKWIDEAYTTIPFPFEELPTPDFQLSLHWTREQFMGYLQSWSSVRHYQAAKGRSPLPQFEEKIARHWAAQEEKPVHFPVFMRLGRFSHP